MSLALFTLVVLEIRSHFLPRSSCNPFTLCLLQSLGWQVHTTMPSFFHWHRVLQTFFRLRLAWNTIPHIVWNDRYTPLYLDIGWEGSSLTCPLAGLKEQSFQSQSPSS
jgi:hypothetical protein